MKNILLAIAILIGQSAMAQVATDSELFVELKKLDSLLFEEGFNQCKIEAFAPYISDDLEFYHDQGGITNGKKDFILSIERNICSNERMKPIRKLVDGTLEVHPLFDQGKLYGAIQSGDHEFYIKEPNKELYKTSVAKFTHLWLKVEGSWTLKRVLSYDHK